MNHLLVSQNSPPSEACYYTRPVKDMGNYPSTTYELTCSTCGIIFSNPKNKFASVIHTQEGHSFDVQNEEVILEHSKPLVECGPVSTIST